jgi:hypothetical protein
MPDTPYETAKCKICGRPHPVDSYRAMRFYFCPSTNRVYLVAKDKDDDNK